MKKSNIFFLIILTIHLPAESKDLKLSCLNDQWELVNATALQKEFDKKNDLGSDGSQISCRVQVTPTELYEFLAFLQRSIERDNIQELIEKLRFPIRVDYRDLDGNFGNTVILKSSIDLELVYLEAFKKVVLKSIVDLDKSKMIVHPYNGIGLNLGQVWINRTLKDRSLSITYIAIHQ